MGKAEALRKSKKETPTAPLRLIGFVGLLISCAWLALLIGPMVDVAEPPSSHDAAKVSMALFIMTVSVILGLFSHINQLKHRVDVLEEYIYGEKPK